MRRIKLANDKYVVIMTPASDNFHQLILDGQPSTILKCIGPNAIAMTMAEINAALKKRDKINKIVQQ